MARDGRGLICLALTEERCDGSTCRSMVEEQHLHFGTAFTVSIEARGRVDDRHLGRGPRGDGPDRDRSDDPAEDLLGPATSSRCAPSAAACWSAPGRPRLGRPGARSPGLSPPPSSARS